MQSIYILAQTREPVVDGKFYPGNARELRETCQKYLKMAGEKKSNSRPLGIIVPHAGYVYSGRIAAVSFNEIEGYNYDAIIVIAPSHTHSFSFASIYEGQYYKTPLGRIRVKQELAKKIANNSNNIRLSKEGHETGAHGEHAIEVELPFIQLIAPEASIVPIVMGTLDYNVIRELGNRLAKLNQGGQYLIVASSDLSHYHSYSEAEKIDERLAKALKKFDANYFYKGIANKNYEACGAAPITTMLLATKQSGANDIQILEQANSGDVRGASKSRVVGYLSAVVTGKSKNDHNKEDNKMSEEQNLLNNSEKKILLELAENTVKAVVKDKSKPEPDSIPEILKQERGAFVTLEKNGNLRGCIGYVMPIKPLWEAVREMAVSAAMKDPRFSPVKEKELDDITVEISVLTVPEKIEDIEEIEVGKHGLIIQRGFQKGLLLPQVATDHGWDRKTFLQQTCRKAGLPNNAWQDESCEIKIFSAQVFSREDLEG